MRYVKGACVVALALVVRGDWAAAEQKANRAEPAGRDASTQPVDAAGIGRKIGDFSLRDFYGKVHSLADYADSRLIVVAFLGNDCPLAQLYGPRLEKLHQEFSGRGATFLGVNSNVQDAPTGMADYARLRGVKFPLLKDAGNAVADRFGAERTPEVFVLDAERIVRYRGRIDDQYGVGYKRQNAGRRDLAVAVEELLDGKSVSVPRTHAVGCIIGRVRKVEPRGEITYTKHVAKILSRHCVECHREKGLAPFPLTTYDEVAGWGETMVEVVNAGRMPPWFADERYGHFVNDNRLTAEEKALLSEWVRNGSPQGDPADLPAAPKFSDGWRIPEPDLVYQMSEPFTVAAEGTLDYQHFVVDPKLDEDLWISMAEARPGNSAVVHHVVMYAVPPEAAPFMVALLGGRGEGRLNLPDRPRQNRAEQPAAKPDEAAKPTEAAKPGDGSAPNKPPEQAESRRRERGPRGGDFGQMVAIYAPGIPPWKYPEGTAMRIPKGSLLVFQMHYTPNGTEQSDRSYVGFKVADREQIRKRVRYGIAANQRIDIPPRDPDYVATSQETFREETLLLNLFPHMHYRGKSFRFEAIYPDGNREILLDVPRYDFNWQLRYDFVEPKRLPSGTQLLCTAHFDNSPENPRNPDPDRRVRFGLQSWEEMLVGYYTAVPAADDPALKPAAEIPVEKADGNKPEAETGGK
jgi:peroxiredoxin